MDGQHNNTIALITVDHDIIKIRQIKAITKQQKHVAARVEQRPLGSVIALQCDSERVMLDLFADQYQRQYLHDVLQSRDQAQTVKNLSILQGR